MHYLLARFLCNARGTTAIEYSLIAGGIALVIITAVNMVGNTVAVQFFAEAAKIKP